MKPFSKQEQTFPWPDNTDPLVGNVRAAEWGVRRRLALTNHLHADFRDEIGKDVRRGLSAHPKSIPSKYFYDARGSRLFDDICRLPEYYPTRIELSILTTAARAIMSFFDRRPGDLVEIGCGSDLKIRRLLERFDPERMRHVRYVPVDISADSLLKSARNLLADFGALEIHGLIADFTRHLKHIPARRKLIVFFGGTFGNFTRMQSIELLRELAGIMRPEDRLIIGLDMVKSRKTLEAAYNDAGGVTADFNRNILSHINRRLGADFDPAAFEHLAFWNARRERIEMHLRAVRPMKVRLNALDLDVTLDGGETIHTEISHKFTRASAEERFRRAGLHTAAWHTDADAWFSLAELRKPASA